MANQPYMTYKAEPGEHIFDALERGHQMTTKGRSTKVIHSALPNEYIWVYHDFVLSDFMDDYYQAQCR